MKKVGCAGCKNSPTRSSGPRPPGAIEIIERGEANLSPEADRANRVTIGHPEGMPLAFSNIYADLAEAISAAKEGRSPDPAANLFPNAEDGLRSMAAVHAAVASAKADGQWVDARPPMFRAGTATSLTR